MKRPQLQLRDLFWLVVVVALALGWWLEHRLHARIRPAYLDNQRRLTSLTEQLDAQGWDVFHDANTGGVILIQRQPVYLSPDSPLNVRPIPHQGLPGKVPIAPPP